MEGAVLPPRLDEFMRSALVTWVSVAEGCGLPSDVVKLTCHPVNYFR